MSELLHRPSAIEERSMDAIIMSANPVLALGIQHLLDDWSDRINCHRHDPSDQAHDYPTIEPDLLILAPQNWQDLAGWLPALRRRYRGSPWLLFTQPRIAGLFLSLLDLQPCTLVPDTASPEQLRSTALTVGADHAGHLTSEVLSLFARGMTISPTCGRLPLPSPVELQCACAVSLSLSNRQIAGILHLSESTIKSHLYRLGQKFGLSSRHELGEYVQRAFACQSATLSWN
jgi:DNA-binding NarL/FixJ family response regulator